MGLIPAMTAEADEITYTEQENHHRDGRETYEVRGRRKHGESGMWVENVGKKDNSEQIGNMSLTFSLYSRKQVSEQQ